MISVSFCIANSLLSALLGLRLMMVRFFCILLEYSAMAESKCLSESERERMVYIERKYKLRFFILFWYIFYKITISQILHSEVEIWVIQLNETDERDRESSTLDHKYRCHATSSQIYFFVYLQK